MTERVLLAGCGDLGLRVAQRLLARGAEVWALRRHPPAVDDPIPGAPTTHAALSSGRAIRWIQGDLTRADTLDTLPTGLTHVAYLPAPDARDPAIYRAVFQQGLSTLLAALDGSALRRVLFVSSTAVYGEHHGDWVDETTSPAPAGYNGKILLETEQWLSAQNVSSVSLRLAGLYGPGRLQLIKRLQSGSARAPRQPVHWANRIHIDDAAAAVDHLLALAEPETVYLGSDGTPLPLHELYAYLAQRVGAPPPADGPAPANVGSKKLNNDRLVASGWSPRWPDARDGYAALLG